MRGNTYTKWPLDYQMAIKGTKWQKTAIEYTYQLFFISRPSKMYPNLDFWFENTPSGNPEGDMFTYCRSNLTFSVKKIIICWNSDRFDLLTFPGSKSCSLTWSNFFLASCHLNWAGITPWCIVSELTLMQQKLSFRSLFSERVLVPVPQLL
jgi:hypothetical protein